MKNFLLTLLTITAIIGVLKVLDIGLAKEQRRQCIEALSQCDKYEESCQAKYMDVCDGVEV